MEFGIRPGVLDEIRQLAEIYHIEKVILFGSSQRRRCRPICLGRRRRNVDAAHVRRRRFRRASAGRIAAIYRKRGHCHL